MSHELLVVKGPLDLTREVEREALELDDTLFLRPNDADSNSQLGEQLLSLDARNPLMGQHVTVHGTQLTASIDNDGEIEPFANPESGLYTHVEQTAATGWYEGMAIRPVYDPEFKRTTDRIVHVVQTETHSYLDAAYNSHTMMVYGYVLVAGAEIVPTLPVKAHSLVDLKHDQVIAAFDRLIFGQEDRSIPEIVREVGKLANRILPNLETHTWGMNTQRISYLNSLDLLSKLKIVTNDFVVGTFDSLKKDGHVHASPKMQAYSFKPDIFEARHGYMRTSEGVIEGGPPELFTRFEVNPGQVIHAPTKDILDYQIAD
jgi:hypothetical protein